ncbi:MAG: Holliday junction ATP-dependent DNA helicase RuvB [Candidatus Jorgensenbacteria bacterium GW2011_GWA1_48_11]|uniref:Holliday junction branch migration complex subunit RuvB n=1 Tax=Candidatus Jorgensenbacteria bacterium GW2011_GWA1_48_11 TaxID=1618660 RepID=A0A0G1WMK2_9BACT|nr:MAG: Holliday junction ATP-dependent DNA helicase RuvB [Candidatus Jorgensenbacteria bacterium GW2011_GWA1_48_11]KKW12051.1 MAG: Holliday junction ATP-dependent DNA helicase RuvB [Candidatus Jorgensenbacteria bacterium GW2011_GWB1_49_9]
MIKPDNKQNEVEEVIDLTLRPTRWEDYVGQEKIKTNLRLMIDAARQRHEVCDHLLFYGGAGLGKTTLAYIIGREMNANIRTTSGPALEKAGDVAAILSNVEPDEILFIDEAHRINKLAEEVLYPALESRKLFLVVGKGPSARTLSLDLPPFTVIAATTKVNLLSGPLRSRFGATFRLDFYKIEDIQKIIKRSAEILKSEITAGAVSFLANAARFTPRVANRLLKRARDYAQVYSNDVIDEKVVIKTLEMLEIDELGLEPADRRLLDIIVKKFNGGPVGVKALATALNEEVGTIEDVIEPFLMNIGLLHRTPAGRIATLAAYKHLKVPAHTKLF